MSFHIDILPIRYRVELPWAKRGELSCIEHGYRIQECVDRGWMVDKGEEGWIWMRETISAPEVPLDADYRYDGSGWPDSQFGRQVFKPGELTLIDGKLCYPISADFAFR